MERSASTKGHHRHPFREQVLNTFVAEVLSVGLLVLVLVCAVVRP